MDAYKVSAVQMSCEFLNIEANVSKAIQFIENAALDGAKLIVLPEAFNTGYYGGDIKNVVELAEDIDGYTISKISSVAKKLGVFVIAPIFLKYKKTVTNSAFLISDEGVIVGSYSKTHLIGKEKEWIRPGDDYPVWSTKLGKISCLICYDICFPETAKLLSAKGADLIVVPAAWRASRYYVNWWRLNLQCRALDNLSYVIGANCIGKCGNEKFAGNTMICNPVGQIMDQLNLNEESIVSADISLRDMYNERKINTVLDDSLCADYEKIVIEMQKKG